MAVYSLVPSQFIGGKTVTKYINDGGQTRKVGSVINRTINFKKLNDAIFKASGSNLASGDVIIVAPIEKGTVIQYGALKINTPESGATSMTATMGETCTGSPSAGDNTIFQEANDLKAAADTIYAPTSGGASKNNIWYSATAGTPNTASPLGKLTTADGAVTLVIAGTLTGIKYDGEIVVSVVASPLFLV